MRRAICTAFAVGFIFNFATGISEAEGVTAPADVRNVLEVLRLAEQTSPQLKAALEREKQASETIRILQAAFYPTLDAEGIQSYGFPGSTSALGIQGLMGSPYRSGLAGGIVSKMTLYDFGRTTHGVRAAKEEKRAAEEEANIIRWRIYDTALKSYFGSALYHSQEESWQTIQGEIARVEREVDHFVETGQRSVVERLLVQDQTEEANTTRAAFSERYRVSLHRLALLTGLPETRFSIPSLTALSDDIFTGLNTGAPSPLLSEAAAQIDVSKELTAQASSENYPELVAMASAGDMDKSRLVTEHHYSGGFGVILPLFEGGRTSARIARARSVEAERQDSLVATQLELDEANEHFDEINQSSKVKLEHLEHELAVASEALRLAKQRYFSFQGTLVDVREAIRNISRIETTTNEVKADLLLAAGSKAVMNGARVQ